MKSISAAISAAAIIVLTASCNIKPANHYEFEDLTTVKELDEMSKRIRVATLLLDDKVYSEILGEEGEVTASSATISRVNRCIKYGNGGYKTVIDRLKASGVELPEAESK